MKRFILLILLFIIYHNIIAQQLKGKIISAKEVIPGAIVFWQGTNISCASDSIGNFVIAYPDSLPANLVTTIIGYNNDTMAFTKPIDKEIIISINPIAQLNTVEVSEKQSSTVNKKFSLINEEVITSKELVKAACCNLSESFSTNASVDVAFTDAVSGAKKIQMLGLDGIYTQILSENMPLLRGLSSAYGINYIPGTWIENILVTKGTGSVVNGYESISGQINLEFLKPQEQKHRLFINAYGNLNGRAEGNIHFTQKIKEKWSTLLFAHSSSNFYKQDMNHDGFLDMPLTKQYSAFNRWDFNNFKNLEAQFGIKALYEERTGGQTNFKDNNDHITSHFYGIGINTKQVDAFAKTGIIFSANKNIGIQASIKRQEQDMFFGLRKYHGIQTNFYGNFIFANSIGTSNHKYKIGSSYLYDNYSEHFNDSAFARTESVPGIFAEYTYMHPDNFSLVAGIRADYHNLFGLFYSPRLHLRWNATKSTTFRLSAGKGYRTSNIFVENQSIFASSRDVIVKEKFNPEIAYNYGVSANQTFKLFNNEAFVNVDFFRTDFENQIVVDLDQHVNKVVFYNLKGQSYSHSLQVDFGMEPIEEFAVKVAYKWYDVKTTYNYELLDKPYVPKQRVMLNLAYSTYKEIWRFDFTTNWFGISRLPSTVLSPIEYQLTEKAKSYFLLQAQITKKFRKFEAYIGCENILNYVQKNPIIAANNPFGPNFDASMIYAPVEGRIIYFGMRMNLFKM